MFIFNRSLIAVLAPIALLMVVVLWSSQDSRPASAPASAVQRDTVPPGQVARVSQSSDRDS